jgi:site-specific DNA recombinase
MRAVIYARYSSDLQREASIEDQIRLCREYVDKENGKIVEIFSDYAISGSSLHNRPGMCSLLDAAKSGGFDLVIAEALDRVSRDQEDIAAIFKRLRHAEIRLITLSEGEISELHVGLKGTMNALFLKDLASKTRRGLEGRVRQGRSGGGNAYGYDVVRNIDAYGEPVRGERRINEHQAAVIRRIFIDYAAGISPRAIAKQLNAENTPAPAGKGWGPSTIHGNRQRGTGILNNELYIGRLVWNRLRYIKDPETGKRISRLNPSDQWIIQEVPELRIVDQALWDKAKARQRNLDASRTAKNAPGYWDRRRPRFLLTGLMQCGACGGGFVNFNKVYIGCANARNKGTCENKLTMRRNDLEAVILEGLQHRLMDESLTKVFCEEYVRHMNRLRNENNAQRDSDKANLAKVERDLDRLVQALMEGVPAGRVKDKISELEDIKRELESRLADTSEEVVRIHPNMAGYYREKVASLSTALTGETSSPEAVEIVRQLIDRIVLTPAGNDDDRYLSVTLEGHMAGILALAMKENAPLGENDANLKVTKLVAGARSQRCLHLDHAIL